MNPSRILTGRIWRLTVVAAAASILVACSGDDEPKAKAEAPASAQAQAQDSQSISPSISKELAGAIDKAREANRKIIEAASRQDAAAQKAGQ